MSRRHLVTTAVIWITGLTSAPFYLQSQGIPAAVGWPAALAIMLEVSLYATLAFEETRARWRWQWVALAAPLPYLVAMVPAGRANVLSALVLAFMASIACGWFRWLPRARWSDFLFIAVMAAPLALKLFPLLYPALHEDLPLQTLGQLMWIRAGVVAVLHDRAQKGVHFGFWPTASEWRVGAAHLILALPFVLTAAYWSGVVRFTLPATPWWLTVALGAGTFFGILWVVALSEEFFFRGLLQQWLDDLLHSRAAGLALASLVFGAAHLGFRGFPNWRFSLVAALAGVFYGLSFRRGGGIRSAMVTHAALVTIWRAFFR